MRINGTPSGDRINQAEYRQLIKEAGSKLENKFMGQILAEGIPDPEREYRFHRVRRWRFDFAWPALKIAAELDGGTWTEKGRHTTGTGYRGDCEKRNEAVLAGWRVFNFDSSMVHDGQAIKTIRRALYQS